MEEGRNKEGRGWERKEKKRCGGKGMKEEKYK